MFVGHGSPLLTENHHLPHLFTIDTLGHTVCSSGVPIIDHWSKIFKRGDNRLWMKTINYRGQMKKNY